MITEAQKQKIIAAIAGNRVNYPSDAKHAASLGISTSVYSAIKNGQTDKALSDANWISIARKLGVNLRGEMEWKAAKTPTFEYITAQLEFHSSPACRVSCATCPISARLSRHVIMCRATRMPFISTARRSRPN